MTCSFLSKEIVKVNDHVLQVVFILFLGTYSTILGGIKNLGKNPKKEEKNQFPILFFSEIGNFNVGGPVNQLIIKKKA
jgi:hypothetical protein